jgi:hypothetical protein
VGLRICKLKTWQGRTYVEPPWETYSAASITGAMLVRFKVRGRMDCWNEDQNLGISGVLASKFRTLGKMVEESRGVTCLLQTHMNSVRLFKTMCDQQQTCKIRGESYSQRLVGRGSGERVRIAPHKPTYSFQSRNYSDSKRIHKERS